MWTSATPPQATIPHLARSQVMQDFILHVYIGSVCISQNALLLLLLLTCRSLSGAGGEERRDEAGQRARETQDNKVGPH